MVMSETETLSGRLECRKPSVLMELLMRPNHMVLDYCDRYGNPTARWPGWCRNAQNTVPPRPVRRSRRRSGSLDHRFPIFPADERCDDATSAPCTNFSMLTNKDELKRCRPSCMTRSYHASGHRSDARDRKNLKNIFSRNLSFLLHCFKLAHRWTEPRFTQRSWTLPIFLDHRWDSTGNLMYLPRDGKSKDSFYLLHAATTVLHARRNS